jgi:hypothetical protein
MDASYVTALPKFRRRLQSQSSGRLKCKEGLYQDADLTVWGKLGLGRGVVRWEGEVWLRWKCFGQHLLPDFAYSRDSHWPLSIPASFSLKSEISLQNETLEVWHVDVRTRICDGVSMYRCVADGYSPLPGDTIIGYWQEYHNDALCLYMYIHISYTYTYIVRVSHLYYGLISPTVFSVISSFTEFLNTKVNIIIIIIYNICNINNIKFTKLHSHKTC